jgi:3D (Asp-Asp-Asp) domain-containing protein
MPIISRSNWRKSFVLVAAIVGFLLLLEIRMLDSQYSIWQEMVRNDGPPPPGSKLRFTATAYCKGSTTASGVNVRTGIAAADTQILPVGSVLNVATGDDRYNGVYTVMDTGPKVQGRLVDLYMWSCHEALKFGRKEIEVTVLRLGWDPRASSPGLINRLFRGREARRVPPAAAPPPGGVPPAESAAGSDAGLMAGDPSQAPVETPVVPKLPAVAPADTLGSPESPVQ